MPSVPAASTTTMWRLVDDKIDAAHLPGIRAARAHARQKAWAAGAAPDPGGWLHVDIDATITIDHSDNKQDAAPTWKKTFGHHGLFAFLDRPAIAGGEGLAGLLRRGNAGSNTAADHVSVLDEAMASLPPHYRPDPGRSRRAQDPGALRRRRRHPYLRRRTVARIGVGFSFGYAVDVRVRDAAEILNAGQCWYPAIDSGGGIRDGAWVAEATDLVDMSSWPAGTRLILRKERPHPGAQLTLHRLRRAPGHRIHHRHPHWRHRGPARRTGVAPSPTRPGGGPHPRGQGHRTGQPALSPRPGATLPGWKSSWPQPIWSHGQS